MAERRERTAAEREAARLERERRRAGLDPAPPPAAAPPPVVEPEPAPSEEHHDHDRAHDELFPFEDPEYEAEAPSGIRRVSGIPARVKRPPRDRAAKRPRRPHSMRARGFAIVVLVVAVALVWFLAQLFQPFHGSGSGAVTVTIPPHSSAGQVGDLLERDGVISSSFFFQLRATLAGERGSLRSGTYHLKRDMSYGDVLGILTKAPPAARVTELTLIEGKSRRQIDALLRSQGVAGSYFAATRGSRLLRPSSYGAPRQTMMLEGFLFPSTYQLREPISIGALVRDQLTAFKAQFARVQLGYARRQHLTPYEVLIIASMVDGEAATARDRSLVASVIYNRLRLGMPLQIDATTRYLFNDYTHALTASQLASPSPYNTRINKGLPPTPIDNPGMAAIQAAAHPARTNFLYFVVKPGTCGTEVFESDYQQFLKDAQAYQNARAQRGGKSPTRC